MRLFAGFILLSASALLLADEKPDRLTVHTWVREDIFAGFMVNDMERFEKGVAKLNALLEKNPTDPAALSWLGGAELYRAVVANEAGKTAEAGKHYKQAVSLMERARNLDPQNVGVYAVTGGSSVIFGDRLPEALRADNWKRADAAYAMLVKLQQESIDHLPLHMKGELLAGRAMAAQRLGDESTATAYLRKIVSSLPSTPYQARAQKWLDQPALAGRSSIVCQSCHEPGRLAARLSETKTP